MGILSIGHDGPAKRLDVWEFKPGRKKELVERLTTQTEGKIIIPGDLEIFSDLPPETNLVYNAKITGPVSVQRVNTHYVVSNVEVENFIVLRHDGLEPEWSVVRDELNRNYVRLELAGFQNDAYARIGLRRP